MTSRTSHRQTDAEVVVTDFAVLFDRHSVAVHRYLARRVGTATADDLLAQTFLVAYERRSTYDCARPDARPWLYGIAGNLVRRQQRDEVRHYRALARTGVAPVAGSDAECHAARVADRVDAAAWSKELSAALADLAAPDREVLLLAAWEQLTYPEIAAALDIPVGTVRSRLHRARSVVRAALVRAEVGATQARAQPRPEGDH